MLRINDVSWNYVLCCEDSDDFYFGKSQVPKNRHGQHFHVSEVSSKGHKNVRLQSWLVDNKDKLEMWIIDQMPIDKEGYHEQYWINALRPTLNIKGFVTDLQSIDAIRENMDHVWSPDVVLQNAYLLNRPGSRKPPVGIDTTLLGTTWKSALFSFREHGFRLREPAVQRQPPPTVQRQPQPARIIAPIVAPQSIPQNQYVALQYVENAARRTLYKCPRCNYSTHLAANFKLHIHRQVPCEDSNYSGVSPAVLREQHSHKMAARTAAACDKCGVPFASKRMKSYHIRHCPVDRLQARETTTETEAIVDV
jgi:hypothetical protein